MGYFANGTEGEMYAAKWCERCIHEEGCAVLHAHLMFNYDECNNDASILDTLIPRSENGNERCRMFVEGPAAPDQDSPDDVSPEGAWTEWNGHLWCTTGFGLWRKDVAPSTPVMGEWRHVTAEDYERLKFGGRRGRITDYRRTAVAAEVVFRVDDHDVHIDRRLLDTLPNDLDARFGAELDPVAFYRAGELIAALMPRRAT